LIFINHNKFKLDQSYSIQEIFLIASLPSTVAVASALDPNPGQTAFFKVVIKTRAKLTAKLTSTGAIRTAKISLYFTFIGRLILNNHSKTFINTINGDKPITNHKIPILAKSTITNAHKGRTNNIENTILTSITINFCQIHNP
jgi:hypothetical protein